VKLKHEFVEFVPDQLSDGVLYVSIPYATVSHKCPCGCGNEVVTPLGPTDWSLIFNGESISLDPSVGNWSFDCKSHYWIRKNRIVWAKKWSDGKIEMNRSYDREQKRAHYYETDAHESSPQQETSKSSWVDRLREFFR
jgi:hypothetical protein